MARLIPVINPSEIKNSGERRIAEALISQLPARVDVFHSFRWLTTKRSHLLEGECDFMILDPNEGLLFIEVKGGSLRFDSTTLTWIREHPDGRRETLKKNPFDQAAASMHVLLERIRQERPFAGNTELPFTFGYAVAFPDAFVRGQLPPNITSDLILDADKCNDLRDGILKVFSRWRRSAHPPLNGVQKEGVCSALFPCYGILPVLWRRVEDQEERLKRLTAEQQTLLDFMSAQQLASIRGVAGSGKTILAVAKAQAMARQGLRTLLLCYNGPLRDWLEQAIPESLQSLLVVQTFHGLVTDFCKKGQIEFSPFRKPSGNRDMWKDVAPERLIDACALLGPEQKFQAIVVDEGQDFHDLWWTALDSVFEDPARKACYYVFFDPKQNLFVEHPCIPAELGAPFVLPVNCRNTARIAEHCAALVQEPNRVRGDAPIGEEPEVIPVQNLKSAWVQAGKKVRSWCLDGSGGLRRSQVAVLTSGAIENTWPKDLQEMKVTQDFDQWRKDAGVLIASWGRFKGLEADAIVIIETPDDDHQAHLYVARSRAKHLLTIINAHQI